MFDVLWVAIVFGWFARSLAFYRPWIVVGCILLVWIAAVAH